MYALVWCVFGWYDLEIIKLIVQKILAHLMWGLKINMATSAADGGKQDKTMLPTVELLRRSIWR